MRPKRDDILLGPVKTSAVPIDLLATLDSQHFLNFFPEPQGQGSFRPGLSMISPANQLRSNYSAGYNFLHDEVTDCYTSLDYLRKAAGKHVPESAL